MSHYEVNFDLPWQWIQNNGNTDGGLLTTLSHAILSTTGHQPPRNMKADLRSSQAGTIYILFTSPL